MRMTAPTDPSAANRCTSAQSLLAEQPPMNSCPMRWSRLIRANAAATGAVTVPGDGAGPLDRRCADGVEGAVVGAPESGLRRADVNAGSLGAPGDGSGAERPARLADEEAMDGAVVAPEPDVHPASPRAQSAERRDDQRSTALTHDVGRPTAARQAPAGRSSPARSRSPTADGRCARA